MLLGRCFESSGSWICTRFPIFLLFFLFFLLFNTADVPFNAYLLNAYNLRLLDALNLLLDSVVGNHVVDEHCSDNDLLHGAVRKRLSLPLTLLPVDAFFFYPKDLLVHKVLELCVCAFNYDLPRDLGHGCSNERCFTLRNFLCDRRCCRSRLDAAVFGFFVLGFFLVLGVFFVLALVLVLGIDLLDLLIRIGVFRQVFICHSGIF